MKIGGSQLSKEMLRLKELGKIDGLVGAKNVGAVIDLWNQTIEKKKEKRFNKDISARNTYYWKLWKRVREEIDLGRRSVKKINIRKAFY